MAQHLLKPRFVEAVTAHSPTARPSDARPTLALVALVALVAALVTAGTSTCMAVIGRAPVARAAAR